MVAEDNTIVGGFGSAVLELASDRGCGAEALVRVGVPDVFPGHDSVESLRARYGLSPMGIADAVCSRLRALV